MQITKVEQLNLVLGVLYNMRACVDSGETYTNINGESFNLTGHAGICWHVMAHTPNNDITGIDTEYLIPAFEKMGLNPRYPVETLFADSLAHAQDLHRYTNNKYYPHNRSGKFRIELLHDLIKYYQIELAELEL